MVDFAFALTLDFFIPFIFVLAIVFGVLQLTNVFKSKAVSFIIALALSLFATTYQPFLNTLWSNFGIITWFFIGIFFIAFIAKLTGLGGARPTSETMAMHAIILFILLAVGWTVIDQFQIDLPYIGSGENLMVIIVLVVIAIIFFLAFKMGTIGEMERTVKKMQEAQKGGK